MDTVKEIDELGGVVAVTRVGWRATKSQDKVARRHRCNRTGVRKGQIVSRAHPLHQLFIVAFLAIGCTAGASATIGPGTVASTASPIIHAQPLATAEPPDVVAADGCGPADAPVFKDPAASTRGGGLYDVRIMDPQADSSAGEVQAAGFVTRVQVLGGRTLRHVSFVKSEAKRPSYAVFYLAGTDVRSEDTEATFLASGGVIVVQTPSDTDVVPPLIAELGDRAASVSIGSHDAAVVHTDRMANNVRSILVQWTSHGYDWRLGAATSAEDAIDFARTWECS